VRLGRALSRARVRLVILDEPFRGLDRDKRRTLMERARRLWGGATLLCIMHDIGETMTFGRVLVVEGGKIVEDDSPRALAARPHSRYSRLLGAEESIRKGLWADAQWRRLSLHGGRVIEDGGAGASRARLCKGRESQIGVQGADDPREEVRCA
jgi:ATP-binding cassette subfamily B protein